MYYDAGGRIAVDEFDGGSKGGGNYRRDDPAAGSLYPFPVSAYSKGTQKQGVYCDEYHRKYIGPWLGGDACGVKGDGGAGPA